MKIKSITLILTLILCLSIASSAQVLLPTSTTGQIVKHAYYTLSYSEVREQVGWLYYERDTFISRYSFFYMNHYSIETLTLDDNNHSYNNFNAFCCYPLLKKI